MAEGFDYMKSFRLEQHLGNLEQTIAQGRGKTPKQHEKFAYALYSRIRKVALTIAAEMNINREQLRRALQLYARANRTIGEPKTPFVTDCLKSTNGYRRILYKYHGSHLRQT